MKEKKIIDHINHKCKYCRKWYKDTTKSLKYVKDKDMRMKLKHLFDTLWINNSGDFDIIFYEFASDLRNKKDIKTWKA